MASLTETNTLNDTLHADRDVANASLREQPIPENPSDEYQYILSFFTKIMKDSHAASTFTDSLYEVATATQTNVLVLFESIKGKNEIELNRVMAYYMNALRSPATLLGVQNLVRPNFYAGRNVLS